jgi:hypothetical protein
MRAETVRNARGYWDVVIFGHVLPLRTVMVDESYQVASNVAASLNGLGGGTTETDEVAQSIRREMRWS